MTSDDESIVSIYDGSQARKKTKATSFITPMLMRYQLGILPVQHLVIQTARNCQR